jgi:hypothetical protein
MRSDREWYALPTDVADDPLLERFSSGSPPIM